MGNAMLIYEMIVHIIGLRMGWDEILKKKKLVLMGRDGIVPSHSEPCHRS
jgi:hypothetical protein